MTNLNRWIVGALAAGLGIVGLFLAARTQEAAMQAMGLLIFAACVVFIFAQIKDACDRKS